MFGSEVTSGLPTATIELIAQTYTNVHTVEDILTLGVVSPAQAKEILDLITCVVDQ